MAQSFGDPPGEQLLPAEAPSVAGAVAERRAEFTTARSCARRALAELGIGPIAIVNDVDGVPLWPPGVVGSLTHCEGFRAAAVARTSTLAAIGIDAEPHLAMPDGVLHKIAAEDEIAGLTDLPGVAADRLLWTAKEAAYKAWFPLTRCWVSPQRLKVTVQRDQGNLQIHSGRFTVRITPDLNAAAAPRLVHGRWLADERFLLAAVTIPA